MVLVSWGGLSVVGSYVVQMLEWYCTRWGLEFLNLDLDLKFGFGIALALKR